MFIFTEVELCSPLFLNVLTSQGITIMKIVTDG